MVPCSLFCISVNNARFSETSVSTTLPIAVTTQVPPFDVTDRYFSRSAPSALPTVTMTLRAIRPTVICAIAISALSISEYACVAPNFSA